MTTWIEFGSVSHLTLTRQSQAQATSNAKIGAKKFVLLHHSECYRDSFHYRINHEGEIERLISDDLRTQHPHSIAIQVSGDFDLFTPSQTQIDSLKRLLLELKLRFPAISIGAHRQVRGDKPTTCPGRKFPMRAIMQWAQQNMGDEVDAHLREVIESQYRP